MSWQVVIWNMFVWSITGLLIYSTESSLWWLILPALFTGTSNVAEIVKGMRELEQKELENFANEQDLTEEAKNELRSILMKANGGKNRRERI